MSDALALTFDTAPVVLMGKSEATACVTRINACLIDARTALLDLYEREGWRALGYASWRACVVSEFGRHERALYRELQAAQIERTVATIAEGTICQSDKSDPIPSAQLQPLAVLNRPEDKRAAWDRAQEIAGSPERVTGRIVQQAVEEIRQPPPVVEPRAKPDVRFTPLPDLTFGGVIPLLAQHPEGYKPTFNRTNNNVEWALWTWNPVTGCLHDCGYCYARDIANHKFAQKFVPTFLPDRLPAPRLMKPPDPAKVAAPFREWTKPDGSEECEGGIGEKNVFVCSMADLFGKWVPREWIEAVLAEVIAAPQWNFLFLTKFPQRLCEFEWPANAWVGTTVDRQYRVEIAEKAFRKVTAGVKWLSCEPLLEPLQFTSLEMFDWVVVGGSSKSTQTPEFFPPEEWIRDLYQSARQAGCKWYEKTNLRPERVREYPHAR